MRFKGLKDFTLGKSKARNEIGPTPDNPDTPQIAEMKKKIQEITQELARPAPELKVPIPDLGNGEAPVGPHGPAEELEIKPDDKLVEIDEENDEIPAPPDGAKPEIKVIKMSDLAKEPTAEVKNVPEIVAVDKTGAPGSPAGAKEMPAPAMKKDEPPKPAASLKEIKLADGDDSLSNLFSQEEAEENPLAGLISSLPDVTVQELMDDLNEIQRIIQEWQQK